MLKADFSFSFEGLTLSLVDLSGLVDDREWLIKEGDDPLITDHGTPFSFELPDNSLFTVSLKVEKGEEEATSSVRIITEDGEGYLYQTVREILDSLLPAGFEITHEWFMQVRAKWQASLWKGLNIPKNHIYDETKWPFLANLLIGYLITRDLIVQSVNKLLLVAGDGGAVKSIKAAPTEVEYHGNSDVLQNLLGEDGILNLVQMQICALAGRLGIYIHGCDQNKVLPIKVLYNSDNTYRHAYVGGPQFWPRKR